MTYSPEDERPELAPPKVEEIVEEKKKKGPRWRVHPVQPVRGVRLLVAERLDGDDNVVANINSEPCMDCGAGLGLLHAAPRLRCYVQGRRIETPHCFRWEPEDMASYKAQIVREAIEWTESKFGSGQ